MHSNSSQGSEVSYVWVAPFFKVISQATADNPLSEAWSTHVSQRSKQNIDEYQECMTLLQALDEGSHFCKLEWVLCIHQHALWTRNLNLPLALNVQLSSEEISGLLLPELPNTLSKAHLPHQESDFHNGVEMEPSTGKHPSRIFHLMTEKFSDFKLKKDGHVYNLH